jgi:hypothetical protein
LPRPERAGPRSSPRRAGRPAQQQSDVCLRPARAGQAPPFGRRRRALGPSGTRDSDIRRVRRCAVPIYAAVAGGTPPPARASCPPRPFPASNGEHALGPSGRGSGRWALLPCLVAGEGTATDELAELVAGQLLARWELVFWDLATHEGWAVNWRDVLWALRRFEARGLVRGGRFVKGFAGEQYALPEARAVRAARSRGRTSPRPAHITGRRARPAFGCRPAQPFWHPALWQAGTGSPHGHHHLSRRAHSRGWSACG